MKPQAAEFQVNSNMKGHEVKMGFDEAATAHLMGVLTDLYSDREKAVIREYCTNARDSHIEAGKADVPIKVCTPTPLAPMFKVMDYGVGLSRTEIETIYSKYGASTKRGTNDANGMLGLGCKSALTYTPQFTLTGIRDGVQTTVQVSRNEDGSGSMTILDERPTDESNGVTITVPVKGANEFEKKAKELFSYWPEGSVLLNDQEVEHIDGLWVAPGEIVLVNDPSLDVYGRRRDRYGSTVDDGGKHDVVVMAGVPYPCNLGLSLAGAVKAVAYVETGALTFAPSREALTDTPLTKRCLEGLKEKFAANAAGSVQREMTDTGSPQEALKLAIQLRDRLPMSFRPSLDELTWQKKPLPNGLDPKDADKKPFWVVQFAGSYRYHVPLKEYSEWPNGVPVEQWQDTLWIEGYDRPTYTDTQRKKLDRFLLNEQLNSPERPVRRYVLLRNGEKAPRQWVDDDLIVQWSDVWEIKLNTAPKVNVSGMPVKIEGSYNVWTPGAPPRKEMTVDELKGKPLFYVTGALTPKQQDERDYGAWSYRGQVAEAEYAEWLRVVQQAAYLIAITPQREERLKKLLPEARELRAYVAEQATKFEDALSDRQKLALRMRTQRYVTGRYGGGQFFTEDSDANLLGKLDPKRIDDPDLKELVAACKMDVAGSMKVHGRFVKIQRPIVEQGGLNGDLSKYPLFEPDDVEHRSHVYTYVNAVYAASTKEDS